MILYDKILRLSEGFNNSHEPWPSIAQHLARCEVFNFDNLQILNEEDPMESCRHTIPKRPPYSPMWIEWRQEICSEDGLSLIKAICGSVVLNLERHILDNAKNNLMLMGKIGHEPSFPSGTEETVQLFSFCEIHRSQITTAPIGICFDGMSVTHLRADSTELISIGLMHADGDIPLPNGLNRSYWSHQKHGPVPVTMPAVAIGAFQLLHCKNIRTETVHPNSRLNRAHIRRGHPSLSSYKILSLTLPATANEDRIGCDVTGQRNRLHLVRGHFKNLQSPRYKEKGWHWWPHHLRGNLMRGYIEKTYLLHQR